MSIQAIKIKNGLTFYSRPNHISKILQKFNDELYLIEETNILTGEVKDNVLLSENEIINNLKNKDLIIEKIKKAIKFHEEQQKEEKRRKQQEQREKEEYENVYGYCDNMTPYQKGKVLKVLNKKVRYNNEVMTRKEFIKNKLSEGYTINVLPKMLTSSKKINGERIEKFKHNVPILEYKENNTFIEITKTEYNYGLYLLDNNIF